jgi:hypothetical protein
LRGVLVALVCVLAALAVRVPLAPRRLYNEDSVTLARAVDRYDPRHLYPQPPGYPLFILQSKILRTFTGDVPRAFLAGVILATAAALLALLWLSHSISDAGSSVFAALLLIVNPIFLYSGMTSPIRIHLAAVSIIVALFCWRAWNGDSRSAWISAIALGIGSGYRPELLALLAPLWTISVWRATRSWKRCLGPTALLALIAGIWIVFLLSRFPDLHAFRETFSKYVTDQARDNSPMFGATDTRWIRMLFRVAMWNGTAIFGWMALTPFARPALKTGVLSFLTLWTLPSIAFHALIHVEDPDQTLSTIPAFCILGGAVLASFWRRNREVAAIGLASAITVNLALFFAPFPLRPNPRFYKPAVDALWQFSYTETTNVRVNTDAVLGVLQPFADREKTLVMWNRSPVTWRTLSYYYPNLTFCLLMDDRHAGTRPHAAFWSDLTLRERYFGDPAVIPLGDADQLLWIVGVLSTVRSSIVGPLEPLGADVWRSPAAPMNIPGYRLVW